MKKISIYILVFLLSVGLMGGCGNSGGDSASTGSKAISTVSGESKSAAESQPAAGEVIKIGCMVDLVPSSVELEKS